MTILKVLQYPDLRLRRKAYLVANIKALKIQQAIKNITETVLNSGNCGALAASQLDLEEPPRIIVFNKKVNHPYKDKRELLCLVNLEIVAAEDYVFEEEGCLSIRSENSSPIFIKIRRANRVKAQALDEDGNQLEFTAEGYFARCIQHECDHLEGILNIDYLEKSERQLIDEITTKLQQQRQVCTS